MLDPENRCFLHHMRGVFDRDVLAEVRSHFEVVESSRQAHVASERDAKMLRVGASTDAFRFDPRWYDPWRRPELAERFRPFTWVMFPVQIRHINEDEHLVPWHQDVAYMRLLERAHARVITCFVPLEPEPAGASTLEFALGDHPDLSHGPVADHSAVTPEPAGEKRRFDLAFGDALVFGDHVPHRSIAGRDGAVDRRSFEFRLVMPRDALPGKDYFDIESGWFVRTDGSRRAFP
jgi:hypothetical protein